MIRHLLITALAIAATVTGTAPTVAQHRSYRDDPASSEWVKRVMREERYREYRRYSRPQPYPAGRSYELTYSPGPRVMGWTGYGPGGPRRDVVCMPPRSVVGVEKYNVEEARSSAVSLWMEAEKLHHGVKFMNPKNAIVVQDDCYLSSTGNRGSEKIAEGVGKTLQQCVFTAIACEGAEQEERR